jgi:hypothetical protein
MYHSMRSTAESLARGLRGDGCRPRDEVKAKNSDGRTVDLYFDASIGKTLKTEEDDD